MYPSVCDLLSAVYQVSMNVVIVIYERLIIGLSSVTVAH